MVDIEFKIVPLKRKPHTEETKRKISERAKERMLDPAYLRKMGIAQKNIWNNPEHRKKMSESQKRAWGNSELRDKQRLAHLGQKSWNKGQKGLQVAWNKGKTGYLNSEARRKMSEAHKGKPAHNKGKSPSKEVIDKQRESLKKTYLLNPELIERIRQNTFRQIESGNFAGKSNTKPERQLKEELLKKGYQEGVDFIHQYKFMDKFMCDFCFIKQKVIIEADGDFWHSNPLKFPDKDKLHPQQIRGLKLDKSRDAYIAKVDNGSWTLLRFWESDINKDVVACVNKIEEVLAEKKKNLPS